MILVSASGDDQRTLNFCNCNHLFLTGIAGTTPENAAIWPSTSTHDEIAPKIEIFDSQLVEPRLKELSKTDFNNEILLAPSTSGELRWLQLVKVGYSWLACFTTRYDIAHCIRRPAYPS